MQRLILKTAMPPGDTVMLTAALRDLHRCYPGEFLTDVRSSCPAIWERNPHLTRMEEDDSGVRMVECHYYPLIERANELPVHCLQGYVGLLNDELDLNIQLSRFRGDLHLSDEEKSYGSQAYELIGDDRPYWVIVAGGKSDLSIKWWSPERYQEVVDHFRGRIRFVQIGRIGEHHFALNGVTDLRGKTDLRQLIQLIYHADGVLCPVTCAMHITAALEPKFGPRESRKCVVIGGGREPAHWEAYPGHQYLHTIGSLPCCRTGGCWRSRTLPLGDGTIYDDAHRLCRDVTESSLPRCMDLISAGDVVRRIEWQLN